MPRSTRKLHTLTTPRLLAAALIATLASATSGCGASTRIVYRQVPCVALAVPPPEPPPELPDDASPEQVEYDRGARSWHHAALTAYAWGGYDACGPDVKP